MSDVQAAQQRLDEIKSDIARLNMRGDELQRIAGKWPAIDGAPASLAWLCYLGYRVDLWLLNKRLPLDLKEASE